MRRREGAGTTVPGSEVAERRRRDLLDAAFSLIAERGLEGLRTRDVAARAGVNISTLHYYFGTKEAMLVAVVDYASERFTAPPPARSRARSRGAPHTLRKHFEHALRTFEATPHLSTVLQELALRGQRDTATRSAFRSLHQSWNEIVESVLRRQVKDGALRADLDPGAAARVVTSFIIGAMVQLGVNPKAFDFIDVAKELEGWLASQ
jgi:AcrR family transcriptional regulator